MSFSISLGNFLYRNIFFLYKPMYSVFKRKQDAFEIKLLQKHIKNNDVVMDIGANIGFYALIISELVGSEGEVHCFEPDRTNFEHLKKNVRHLSNAFINEVAASAS